MKTLYLLRHSKSSWSTPSLDDFDRPLNERGKRDAPFMGDILAKKNIFPQFFVTSPALRAVKTSEVIAKKINYPIGSIIKERNLYEASALDILSVIKKTDNKIESLMLVGHNPGMTDLINIISNRKMDNLPTSGIVCLKKETESWDDDDEWEFVFIEYPS